MESYEAVQKLYDGLPAFTPIVPTGLLPVIALTTLTDSFLLGFYFTTLPRTRYLSELLAALTSSALAGFGVVALFNYLGVYV